MKTSEKFRLSREEWRGFGRVWVGVSLPFVMLDIAAHSRGWWDYNPAYIIGKHLFGLPLEEIAFFFVVPFCSIYLLTCLKRIPQLQKNSHIQKEVVMVLVCVAAAALAWAQPKERTILDVTLGTALSLLAYRSIRSIQLYSLIWAASIAVLFLTVNGVLTSLPVVIYNPAFGSNIRIGSIPLEDIFYNVSLLLSSALVFRGLRHRAGHP